jgi:release factor glutamine methyltransferase
MQTRCCKFATLPKDNEIAPIAQNVVLDFTHARQRINKALRQYYSAIESNSIADELLRFLANAEDKFPEVPEGALILTEAQKVHLGQVLTQIAGAMPLQYIRGYCFFGKLQLAVNPSVLIPRPETEELCQYLCTHYKNHAAGLRILDIGCGSGCIGIYLATALPDVELTMLDLSADALEVAQRNASTHQVKARYVQQSALAPLAKDLGAFDIIVSNPPYICAAEAQTMHPNVLEHEPHIALFVPDEDALVFYRAIGEAAQQHLASGGRVYFEINSSKAKDLQALLVQQGFSNVRTWSDMYGLDRFAEGTKS